MGQVDFGKIISAAAVSTLGVLSLIVVALGVLAFYFFKGSPEKVKLTVWWTALVAGVLFGAAVLTQGDRQSPAPRPTGTPAPVDPVTPVPMPTPTESPGPQPSASAISRPVAAAASDLSGRWHDNEGYIYDVIATGSTIMYQVYQNGQNVGAGQGSREGNTLRYGFWSKQDGSQGTCQAIVATDQRSMSGTCTSGGESWPMFAER